MSTEKAVVLAIRLNCQEKPPLHKTRRYVILETGKRNFS